MKIKRVDRYVFQGKEYRTLEQVKAEIENQIGAIIDEITNGNNALSVPKSKLHILGQITKPEIRKKLVELLNIEVDINDGYDDPSNIFDLF